MQHFNSFNFNYSFEEAKPDIKRSFKVPFSPIVPGLAVLFCGFLITQLSMITLIRFVVWLAIGFVVYFKYGRHNSVVNSTEK